MKTAKALRAEAAAFADTIESRGDDYTLTEGDTTTMSEFATRIAQADEYEAQVRLARTEGHVEDASSSARSGLGDVETRDDEDDDIDTRAALKGWLKNDDATLKSGLAVKIRSALTTVGVVGGEQFVPKKNLGHFGADVQGIDLLDVFYSEPTDEGSWEYSQEVLAANAVTAISEGNLKPEQAYSEETKQGKIKVYPVWSTFTRQALRNLKALFTRVTGVHQRNIRLKMQDAFWNGTGETVDGNVQSIGVRNSGILEFDGEFGTDGEGIFRTIRRAKTMSTLTNGPLPTHYVINPEDAEELDWFLDNKPRDIAGRIGLTAIVTPVQPKGSVVVGPLTDADTIRVLYRDSMETRTSDSHGDNFVRNLVTVLTEQEGDVLVPKPHRIVEGTFGAKPVEDPEA